MADWNCNLCKEYQSGIACTYCDDGSEFVRMTNADRIWAMSDEELAKLLKMYVNCTCEFCVGCGSSCSEHNLKWLQSEAE